jgi:hypothetical protein
MEAPDSLVNRTIADPGQVATNVGGSALAGLLGMPGDLEQLSRSAFTPGLPSKRFLPSTEDIQGLLGAEPGRPESLLGEFAAPDPMDIARAGGRGLLAMTLFHGTPHKFDAFDMRKIGTGEGAQAYGHGLYFAESPGVAKSYQNDLTDFRLELDGHQIDPSNAPPEMQMIVRQVYSNPRKIGLDEVRELAQEQIDTYKAIDGADEIVAENQSIIDTLDSLKGRLKESKGHLYEVDIPDETIDKMLDWDAPLSEQPESVRNVLNPMFDTGSELLQPEQIKTPGSNLYQQLSRKFGGDDAASAWLSDQGIPGIRYFDGSSRSAGEGTRNIVVFDESAINKVKRDGEEVFNRIGK